MFQQGLAVSVMPSAQMTPEKLAKLFHETYEARSVEFGYKTREATAKPWEDIPADSPNKRLMIAVCTRALEVLEEERVAAIRVAEIAVINGLLDQIEGRYKQYQEAASGLCKRYATDSKAFGCHVSTVQAYGEIRRYVKWLKDDPFLKEPAPSAPAKEDGG